MAAFIMESADIGAGFDQSLAEKLALGELPLPVALFYAIDLAGRLRELHQKGLAHGELNAATVLVGKAGAILAPRGTRTGTGDSRSDVKAFGELLYRMLTGHELPEGTKAPAFTQIRQPMVLGDVRRDALRLAEKCHGGWPDIKQVLIELRILGIQARRLGSARPRLKLVDKPATSLAAPVEPSAGPRPALALVPPLAVEPTVCPRCYGPAPMSAPETLGDRLIGKFTPMRECSLCRYRFVVIHVKRQP